MLMDIKIFSSHRIDFEANTINDNVFVPIRSGAVFDNRKNIGILGDDTGDNISELNRSFCELTAIYWAWKNADADYYGLCHYRRFLNFSGVKYPTDSYGNIIESEITPEAEKKYGLDGKTIESVVKDYDIVVSEALDVRKFPERYSSIRDHYASAPNLHGKDIDTILNIISESQPDYYQCAKNYFDGKRGNFCSLFVMKKALFDEYCNWLFPLLFEFDKRTDMSLYTTEGKRTPGHIAERLLGIFVNYQKEKNGIKVKELQTVLFLNAQKKEKSLQNAEFENDNPVIPIVFTSTNEFLPVLSVTIQSIIEHSSEKKNYDIVILTKAVDEYRTALIKNQIAGSNNFSIRFFDVSSTIAGYRLKASDHISSATYYRFLIQDVLPNYDKVLYLDSDIVCNRDVSELFDMEMGEAWIAAAKDPDFIGQVSSVKDIYLYAKNQLKMDNPYDYFQAGVLLLNTKELRKNFTAKKWLEISSEKQFRYMDQDILNAYCEHKVVYFDMKWNMLIDCNNYRVPVLIKSTPDSVSQEYFAARKSPYIIHYAGYQKPWNDINCDMFEQFWIYARKAPFYERLYYDFIKPSRRDNKKSKRNKYVSWFRKHTPKWLRPFAVKIKRKLGL